MCLATTPYVYTTCPVCVTIFSTGSKFRVVSNLQSYTLHNSYVWSIYTTVYGRTRIVSIVLYFFNQTPWLLFFSLLFFLWLLFKGGIYFFRKPADINDGWIRYVRVIMIQQRLLDTISSKHCLSVLLSAMETSRTTRKALELTW